MQLRTSHGQPDFGTCAQPICSAVDVLGRVNPPGLGNQRRLPGRGGNCAGLKSGWRLVRQEEGKTVRVEGMVFHQGPEAATVGSTVGACLIGGGLRWEGVTGRQGAPRGSLARPDAPGGVWLVLLRRTEVCVSLSPWPAVKNHVTGNFVFNPKGKETTSRTFTAMGLEWEYVVEDAKASLKTSGPLPEAIAVLVSPHPARGPCRPLAAPAWSSPLTVSAAGPVQARWKSPCCTVFRSLSKGRVPSAPGQLLLCARGLAGGQARRGKIQCLTVRPDTPHTGGLFSLTEGQKWGLQGVGGTWVGPWCCPGLVQRRHALWHRQPVSWQPAPGVPSGTAGFLRRDQGPRPGWGLSVQPCFLDCRPVLMEWGL